MVIHDDIDLDFGRLKLKQGGGHGGQRSAVDFCPLAPIICGSVAVSVGPTSEGGEAKGERVVGHVPGPFAKAEQRELPAFLDTLADAVEDIVRHGLPYAMNRHNGDGRSKGSD